MPGYYPAFYYPRTPDATGAASDLVAAVVARLRAWDSGSLAAALGESGGAVKVWGDAVEGSPGLPWVRVTEAASVRAYSSGFRFIETGQLQIDVFAAGRKQARDLGRMLAGDTGAGAGALDDPGLTFGEGSLMAFRLASQSFAPAEGPGVGSPVVYHRVLLFHYTFSGNPTP